MVDILFLILSRLQLRAPIPAPAILKAVVESHGYKSFCYDLNLDLWLHLDASKYGEVWFETNLTFRYKERFKKFWNEVISSGHTERWINTIKEKNPTWVGITAFSQRSQWITIAVCKLLKSKIPNIKIVVGGPYAEYVGPNLYKRKLIDAYVVGEGEHAILEILKNNFNYPGINGLPAAQINDLDTIPIPDYSDFSMDKYPATWEDPRIRDETKMGTKFAYITGSRGCVRKCSFCDIQSIWPKFRYRSGKIIAEEMKIQNKKYGTETFIFTDSLINGSIKQLKDICETLIEYKEKQEITSVRWQGQFIARSEHQMPEESYRLLKQAGCHYVQIGVESGSEKIRRDIKKMMDDDALDFTFRMCAKYEIKMSWLLLVGYPTETEEEFQKTLDMLEKYSWINEKGLVASIELGPTLDIVPGSPLYNDKEKLGIKWTSTENWSYGDNTREVRLRRWLRLKEKCLELNYSIVEKVIGHLLEELKQIEEKKLRFNNINL